MLQTLVLIGILLLLILAIYENNRKAQNRCKELASVIIEDEKRFNVALSTMIKQKSIDSFNDFTDIKGKWYLIEKTDLQLIVYSLNNDKNQTILESQYDKLILKLEETNPNYKYSIESYSVYYRLPIPNENCILRIDY